MVWAFVLGCLFQAELSGGVDGTDVYQGVARSLHQEDMSQKEVSLLQRRVGLAPAPESTEDGPAKSLTSAMGQAVGAVVRQHVIEMLQPERADKVSREAQKIVNESNAQPCACEKYRSSWTRTSRSEPRCIFIDLGAANGDTFRNFLDDGYGPVRDCGHGSGRWEAYLVEANPYFQPQLKIIAQNDQHRVHQFGGRAAYVCEGHASFYVAWDPNHNHWGSSMDPQLHHGEDWQHMGSLGFIEFNKTIKVTVPTININKLIYENTIPDDYVIVRRCKSRNFRSKIKDHVALHIQLNQGVNLSHFARRMQLGREKCQTRH